MFKDGKIIIKGYRNRSNGLWNVPLAPTSQPTLPATSQRALGVIQDFKTKQELAGYFHACMFSPTPATFHHAVKRGHFTSWPGLTVALIYKHLAKSLATSMGHLRMQQKNIQSTTIATVIPLAESIDFSPSQEPTNPRTNTMYASMVAATNIRRSYSDQTGRFPVQSSRGNNYVFILYDHDSNAILSIPLKNRQAKSIADAWQTCHTRLQTNGYAPDLHIIDNECSDILKQAFTKYHIDFQRVPPHTHRRNAAERAIQTWKNHLLAGLSTCDPDFPPTEWDLLLPQCDATLNLLRASRRQPKLSSYACLNGAYDFNRMPLAPPGTKVVIHETPDQRDSWAPHGVQGWYIGPATEHYRCHKCYIPSTAGIRDALTLDWFPKQVPFPKVSTEDYLRQTASDMLAILANKEQTNKIPSLSYGSEITNAYTKIATFLSRATSRPLPTPTATAIESPAAEMRVPHSPPALPTKNPAAPLRVPTPTPMPPLGLGLPPQRLHIIPPSPTQSTKPPAVNVPSLLGTSPPPLTTRFGHAIHHIAQNVIKDRYEHHIAALVTPPAASGKQPSLDKLLRGPDATTWQRSNANEWGRLLPDGVGKSRPAKDRITGTGTLAFIRKTQVPAGRKVTYANWVCAIRNQKAETHRVRMTAGGDRLDCPYDVSSPAVSMTNAKLHINSTISDAHRGARYLGIDISNFYLGTDMPYHQYLRVPPSKIPQEIWDEYNIDIAPDGIVYCEIRKGMYGLKEAGILNKLVKALAPHGYKPMPNTTGLWKHTTRQTTFALCVDDFGVKYFSREDADHLINALRSTYNITIDWTGSLYCGLTLKWNYAEGWVDIYMPEYVIRALTKFNHPAPTKPQHAPHAWVEPIYGLRRQQSPTTTTDAPLLDAKGTIHVQGIAGTFLFYGRAVDPCILPALNEIAAEQAKPTTDTAHKCDMLMDYLHTNPNAVIRYTASDMILKVVSDAAFLVLPQAHSRAAAVYHLGWSNNDKRNGLVDVLCQTIKNVVASASEAETGGIYLGARHCCPMRIACI